MPSRTHFVTRYSNTFFSRTATFLSHNFLCIFYVYYKGFALTVFFLIDVWSFW